MGLWLTVGKAALKVGLPAVAAFARERLQQKQAKASLEDYHIEDAQYRAAKRRRERVDRRRAETAKR